MMDNELLVYLYESLARVAKTMANVFDYIARQLKNKM